LPPSPPSPPRSKSIYSAYFATWSDPYFSSANNSALANLPPYITHVILAFMRPDTTYPGGVTFQGTGIDFSSDPAVVRDAIQLLKQRTGAKVLVAVGGATYTGFGSMNTAAIAKFVAAFGLDGVDLDYEPSNPGCTRSASGTISCATDAEYISSVKALRVALPRPLILSNAPWSIGAYGEGAFVSAPPVAPYTGVALGMLRAVGDQLDLLNVMSYDASPVFDSRQAFDAYKTYFKGDIAMGVEVANEAWGGHVITLPEVDALADHVLANGGAGLMLWSLQKQADQGPTAQQISQRACTKLGLPNCSCGLSCKPAARR
jgi:chitinase